MEIVCANKWRNNKELITFLREKKMRKDSRGQLVKVTEDIMIVKSM